MIVQPLKITSSFPYYNIERLELNKTKFMQIIVNTLTLKTTI